MIKVLVNGCNGKMGQEVAASVRKTENMEVCCGVDRVDGGDNYFPVYTNINDIDNKPDIIIDFSVPQATFSILEYARETKTPIVIATTGFSEEELNKIKEYSREIPIFQSYNMSYSINVMRKVVAELAKLFNNSDIEIVDVHHRRKVDSPSGTALMLANSINTALDNSMTYEYNRHSKREKRSDKEIGIHSIRGGTEAGKHTVMFLGENESFEVTHNVTSRSIFADGAVKAAEFLINQEPGFYNMDNI